MDSQGFDRLVELLRTFTPRSEIILEEVPAPQKLASYTFAFSADVSNGLLDGNEDEIASGRFVLLHEPGGQETWDGEFRCVTFARADLDTVMKEDPALPEFGWNWLLAALATTGCVINNPAGTVTRVTSASFGKLSPRNNVAEIEIRASWTPVINSPNDLLRHIQGWCNLIGEIAGLPPIPDGVSAITSTRRR